MTRDEWLHHRERVHSRDKAVMILDDPLVPDTEPTGMDGNNEAGRMAVLNRADEDRAAALVVGRCQDEGPYIIDLGTSSKGCADLSRKDV